MIHSHMKNPIKKKENIKTIEFFFFMLQKNKIESKIKNNHKYKVEVLSQKKRQRLV